MSALLLHIPRVRVKEHELEEKKTLVYAKIMKTICMYRIVDRYLHANLIAVQNHPLSTKNTFSVAPCICIYYYLFCAVVLLPTIGSSTIEMSKAGQTLYWIEWQLWQYCFGHLWIQ